jgi:AraC family transcriptional activator of pobA
MTGIENYNLYGEESDFPDVVHCETIETRSLVHDWEFGAHRHQRLHQILLVEEGGGTALLEDRKKRLRSGDMVNVPAGVVHGFTFEPQTKGWVVTITAELLEESLLDGEGLRNLLKTSGITQFDASVRGIVEAIFDEHATQSFARAHVLRGLSGVLVGLLVRTIAQMDRQIGQKEHGLQKQFDALLKEQATSHLRVADYAEQLGVTPTHLSRVLREATGLSASATIEARLMREARRNLAFTNLRISDIAYQLGYEDPAYFTRVFKRATGVSPRQFRQNLDV